MKQLFVPIKYIACHQMLTALIPQCVGLENKLSVEQAFTIIAMIALMRTSIHLLTRLAVITMEATVDLIELIII